MCLESEVISWIVSHSKGHKGTGNYQVHTAKKSGESEEVRVCSSPVDFGAECLVLVDASERVAAARHQGLPVVSGRQRACLLGGKAGFSSKAELEPSEPVNFGLDPPAACVESIGADRCQGNDSSLHRTQSV